MGSPAPEVIRIVFLANLHRRPWLSASIFLETVIGGVQSERRNPQPMLTAHLKITMRLVKHKKKHMGISDD